MRIEQHNLHGTGHKDHEVYDMQMRGDPDYWAAVTNVPCPVAGCTHTIVWYEAGYVPGYRVCMRSIGPGKFDKESLRHRFVAKGSATSPVLVRDDCCE